MTQIEDDEPITSEHVTKVLQFLQNEGVKEIKIRLIKRSASSSTHLDLRSTFDKIESSKYELNKFDGLDVLPSSNYLFTSPIPIKAPRDFRMCSKTSSVKFGSLKSTNNATIIIKY